MRIGFYGGTFDPPHGGHLAVARAALAALALDRIEMTPSHTPPHRGAAQASGFDRFAMLALACQDEARIVASPRELLRGGVSYTVDSLRELRREAPGAALYLVLGADAYDDLPQWREAEEIVRLAHLVVLPRPGSAGLTGVRAADAPRLRAPDPSVAGGPFVFPVEMPPMPAASREIRALLAAGGDAAGLVARPVLRYIGKRALYGVRGDEGEPAR